MKQYICELVVDIVDIKENTEQQQLYLVLL